MMCRFERALILFNKIIQIENSLILKFASHHVYGFHIIARCATVNALKLLNKRGLV